MKISLDHRLEADSVALGRLSFCEVRLMKDARWPWLLLIPQGQNLSEMHELSDNDQLRVIRDMTLASIVLKNVTGCLKINTGALGNMVRQLHIHIIARNEGDANWPGPVWGYGTCKRYAVEDWNGLVSRLISEFNFQK